MHDKQLNRNTLHKMNIQLRIPISMFSTYIILDSRIRFSVLPDGQNQPRAHTAEQNCIMATRIYDDQRATLRMDVFCLSSELMNPYQG